jgi:uncharacterized membrane protein YgdD (TMEM256/DUF423 family)
MYQRTVALGAFLTGVGVILGAFGAHALKGSLTDYGVDVFKTASFYHLTHGIALLGVTALGSSGVIPHRLACRVAAIFAAGIAIFSGSLYLLAVTEVRWLGAITPIGGLLMIVGWLLLGFGALYPAGLKGRIDNPPPQG